MERKHVEKQSMTPKDFSEAHSISEGTLANWRWQKKGPRYYRVGRKIIYKVADIEAWLFSRPVLTIDSLEDYRGGLNDDNSI
jgi:hypothetical protein